MRCHLFLILLLLASGCAASKPAVVFQTDFGQRDGAVSEMKGVAAQVDPTLRLHDLTHEIPAYNIWEAAYRLHQTMPYWPAGTVFVSVVDPGVGTDRKSVVLKTRSGHYVVTPDNGTLTLVAEHLGLLAVREIDEQINRLPGSENSHTFHGRDVYAYTAARLASGQIRFEQVGPRLPDQVVRIPYQQPTLKGGKLRGAIPVLDPQYGNVWTNIDRALFEKLGLALTDTLEVTLSKNGKTVFRGRLPYVKTFGDVRSGKPLAYFNSQDRLSFAINMGNFARTHGVGSGAAWSVSIGK